MKKIGILSDTHSYWDDRYALYFNACDEIWHAGDVGDIDLLQQLKGICPVVRAVSGNIDHGIVRRVCPETMKFETEGVKVFSYPYRGVSGTLFTWYKKNVDRKRNQIVCLWP